jgi:hypothetical protein
VQLRRTSIAKDQSIIGKQQMSESSITNFEAFK